MNAEWRIKELYKADTQKVAELESLKRRYAFSLKQIVNVINLAGFGNEIGSGRSSSLGRFHVEDVK